jgi:hypothetical protein
MATSSWPARRALTVILALAALSAAAGCSRSGSSAAGPAASPALPASAAATVANPASGAGTCTAGYCTPASWDTAIATTPLAAIRPFLEPLNVIISARSTVSLASLQAALGDWKTVSASSSASVAGIRVKCISPEEADVNGTGYTPQALAWRLGGCLDGNLRSLSGTEDHLRIWHQAVPGSAHGAWIATASIETMCIAPHGELEPAVDDKPYAVVHSAGAYHCVDGGPGSITSTYADGYDDGARLFAAAVATAARARGWTLAEQVITRQVTASAATGEGGVPFSGTVYVLTLTARPRARGVSRLVQPSPTAARKAPMADSSSGASM